jgi:hypothetical protein
VFSKHAMPQSTARRCSQTWHMGPPKANKVRLPRRQLWQGRLHPRVHRPAAAALRGHEVEVTLFKSPRSPSPALGARASFIALAQSARVRRPLAVAGHSWQPGRAIYSRRSRMDQFAFLSRIGLGLALSDPVLLIAGAHIFALAVVAPELPVARARAATCGGACRSLASRAAKAQASCDVSFKGTSVRSAAAGTATHGTNPASFRRRAGPICLS